MPEFSVDELKEPTRLISLLCLAWVIIAIFDGIDPNRYIFVGLMLGGSIIALYYQIMALKTKNRLYNSPLYIYILFFSGITSYTVKGLTFTFLTISLPLFMLEGLILLPTLLIWLFPKSSEQFFKVRSTSKEEKIGNIWKVGILILYVVKYLELDQNYEFLVLIPMIVEPVMLGLGNKGKLPMLTLQLHKEILAKFSPHLSLLRSVMLIQLAFITSFLNSKIWILLLMLFITSIFLLILGSIIYQFSDDKPDKTREEVIHDVFGDEFDYNGTKSEETLKSPESAIHTSTSLMPISNQIKDSSSLKIGGKSDLLAPKSGAGGTGVTGDDLPSKAYRLGRKIRTEIKKPKYNLTNILATLRNDSFENGYVVDRSDYRFNSNKGVFNPPEKLVLFPIDLGQFDYRRHGEVLLLGFNKPKIKKSDDEFKKIGGGILVFKSSNTRVSKNNPKSKFSIGDEYIQFEDKVFNLQTLIVSKDEWIKISNTLQELDDNYDLSYTGFNNIGELQGVLTNIGDKWYEVREKAKIVAANFVAGLIGAEDAIFYGVDDLLGENKNELIGDADYELLEEAQEELEEQEKDQ